TPSGTVTFTEGATTLASGVPVDATGHASFGISSLVVGSHTITATFSGSTGWLGSSGDSTTPQIVNPADTTTTVASSASPSVFGQSVSFTATVTANPPSTATVNTGTVQFLIDGVNFGAPVSVDSSGMGTSGATTTLTPGMHTITANYSDGT